MESPLPLRRWCCITANTISRLSVSGLFPSLLLQSLNPIFFLESPWPQPRDAKYKGMLFDEVLNYSHGHLHPLIYLNRVYVSHRFTAKIYLLLWQAFNNTSYSKTQSWVMVKISHHLKLIYAQRTKLQTIHQQQYSYICLLLTLIHHLRYILSSTPECLPTYVVDPYPSFIHDIPLEPFSTILHIHFWTSFRNTCLSSFMRTKRKTIL